MREVRVWERYKYEWVRYEYEWGTSMYERGTSLREVRQWERYKSMVKVHSIMVFNGHCKIQIVLDEFSWSKNIERKKYFVLQYCTMYCIPVGDLKYCTSTTYTCRGSEVLGRTSRRCQSSGPWPARRGRPVALFKVAKNKITYTNNYCIALQM